jgi:hypothetical protein
VAHDTDVTPSKLLYGSNLAHNLVEKRCIEYAIRRADSIVVQTERQAELFGAALWSQPRRDSAKLSSRVPGNVRFIMVGALGGGKAWRESLLRSIERAPNLDYVGPRTQEEVNDLLARGKAWQRHVRVVT